MTRLKTLCAVAGLAGLAAAFPLLAAAEGLDHPKDAVAIFEKATAEGDAETIAKIYGPEATLLMPDGKSLKGREAIRANYEKLFAAASHTLDIKDVSLDGAGPRAVMIWSWDYTITPQGRDPIDIRGRSMLYWLKGEEGWQIAVDMYQQVPQR